MTEEKKIMYICLQNLNVDFNSIANILGITKSQVIDLLTETQTFYKFLELKGIHYDGEMWLDKNDLPLFA